jgi:large subunit ribosomal protein L25
MNVVPLTVETGRETGKGASRRLRTDGRIPATVYGGALPPTTVTIERAELRRALSTPAGANALIELRYGSESHFTLVKEIQRHPVRREPIHIDLQRIDPEKPMSLTVPIVLEGEAKKVTSNGGYVDQALNGLPVSVRPDSIPNEIRISIADMDIDQTLTVADLILPSGVVSEVDPGDPVVTAALTRAAIVAHNEEEGGEGVEGEGGEGGEATGEAGDGAEAAADSDS